MFLPNVLDPRPLWVKAPGMSRCELQVELAEKADPQVYFETLHGAVHHAEIQARLA